MRIQQGPEFFDYLAFVEKGIGHAHLAKGYIMHLVEYGIDCPTDIELATEYLADAIDDLTFVLDELKSDIPKRPT